MLTDNGLALYVSLTMVTPSWLMMFPRPAGGSNSSSLRLIWLAGTFNVTATEHAARAFCAAPNPIERK